MILKAMTKLEGLRKYKWVIRCKKSARRDGEQVNEDSMMSAFVKCRREDNSTFYASSRESKRFFR